MTRVRAQALTSVEHVYSGIYTVFSRGRGNERAGSSGRSDTSAAASVDLGRVYTCVT